MILLCQVVPWHRHEKRLHVLLIKVNGESYSLMQVCICVEHCYSVAC